VENNLRDAIQLLLDVGENMAKPEVLEIAGKTYCTKNLQRYDKEEMADPLTACSLTSLLDYLAERSDELRESMIVHVESPTRVRLLSGLIKGRRREELFCVKAYPNGFQFDRYYNQEDFVINMQTAFRQTNETKLILAVAGNVENKTVSNYGDDGTSQKATISRGIAGKADVEVPNPVHLQPYRTFLEVDQPESKFVFRITEGGNGVPMFKLVEADGGLWKYDAVNTIKEYLRDNIKDHDHIAIIG